MSLASIADITISASTVTPSRASFGTPLVVGYHTLPGPKVQAFRSLAEAEEAGITAAAFPSLHLVLAAVFSQNPRPQVVKVGRRTTAPTQLLRFIPKETAEGFTYKITVDGEELSYTVPAAATVASICTALEALLDGAGFVADSSSGTHVDAEAPAAGGFLEVSYRSKELALEDRTELASTGLDADLSAFELEDPDFYGILLEPLGGQEKAAILAAAAWAETRQVLLVVQTADTSATDPLSSTDTLAQLAAQAYARTVPCYHPDVGEGFAASWLAGRLVADAGSDSWAYKRLAAVAAYRLTGTEEQAIKAKKGNVYTLIGGIGMTRWGWSSAGEWADTTRGIDWLRARMQERVVFVLANNPKIPYTDKGVDVLRGELFAQLEAGETVGFLAPGYTVTALPVAQVDAVDRAARTYPGLSFSAPLAGAIHQITVRGNLLP